MTIIASDSVSSVDDVIIKYVNHLLHQHAMAQHMLANQTPPDARALARVSEVRAKNTELEVRLQEQGNALRALHEHDVTLINENGRLRQEVRELKLQLDQLQHERPLETAPINTVEVSVPRFAEELGRWCRETFGQAIYQNAQERAARLIEEAIEVGQTVGLNRVFIENITTMVYSKEPGELKQELGGVIVCWGVMCDALGIQPSRVMIDAKDDCWTRQHAIRNKLTAKILAGASPTKIEDAPGNIPGPKYGADVNARIEDWRKSIDGAAAIRDGREALKHHAEATHQPSRGE